MTESKGPYEAILTQAGMSREEAWRKASLFAQCHAVLDRSNASTERFSIFVPGRIEFLGKHTDYAGGRSLLCAVERGICFVAAPRVDERLIIQDLLLNEVAEFSISDLSIATQPGWSRYLRTVARRVFRNFPGTRIGANIALASDLPPAAGLSSSSALVTGFFRILADVNTLPRHPVFFSHLRSPESLAEYLGCIESGRSFEALSGDHGVGTLGGCQDHAAILLSEPGGLVQYAFGPLRREGRIPLPTGFTLAVAVSGVAAEKTGDAMAPYNRAARMVGKILELWSSETGKTPKSLIEAATADPDRLDHLRRLLGRSRDPEFEAGALLGRLEQAVMESTVLIPDAAQALRQGDLAGLGTVVDLSQMLAERLLGNQLPQTIALARSARELGAAAASAFGAGFGGSVWALVEEDRADEFLDQWNIQYIRQFRHNAPGSAFFLTRAGPPLTRL